MMPTREARQPQTNELFLSFSCGSARTTLAER